MRGLQLEVVTQLTENEPKFNRGDPRHVRLFCLASEILARAYESSKSCVPTLTDQELLNEFDSLDREIEVLQLLRNLRIHKWIDEHAKSKHVILQLSKGEEGKDGELKIHQFDLELEASNALAQLEKDNLNDDIVLVGADNVAEVTSAFRNYFADVIEFLSLIDKRTAALAGKAAS
jgi:hypothetical protein